jgi:hypothetical protein
MRVKNIKPVACCRRSKADVPDAVIGMYKLLVYPFAVEVQFKHITTGQPGKRKHNQAQTNKAQQCKRLFHKRKILKE